MALTFPRAMPPLGVGQQIFEIDRADYMTQQGSGRIGSVQAGFPLWRGLWTLASAITPAMSDDWRAFVTSVDGPSRLFFGYDVERPFPRAYPNGFAGLDWDGDAGAWAASMSDDAQPEPLLNLADIPPGLVISTGDYIGFRWQTGGAERRSLVRAQEPKTANDSGVITGLSIRPPVPAVTPDSAVAYLANPNCLMRLDPAALQPQAMDRRRVVAGSIIGAIQDLLP